MIETEGNIVYLLAIGLIAASLLLLVFNRRTGKDRRIDREIELKEKEIKEKLERQSPAPDTDETVIPKEQMEEAGEERIEPAEVVKEKKEEKTEAESPKMEKEDEGIDEKIGLYYKDGTKIGISDSSPYYKKIMELAEKILNKAER